MEEGASLDNAEMPSFMDVEEGESEDVVLDYNLKLPFKIRRQMTRERKMAEGTWLESAEWKKAKGTKPRVRKRKHLGAPETSVASQVGGVGAGRARDVASGSREATSREAFHQWKDG